MASVNGNIHPLTWNYAPSENVADCTETVWLQIDLLDLYFVDFVRMWMYWQDARRYRSFVCAHAFQHLVGSRERGLKLVSCQTAWGNGIVGRL